MIAGNPASLSVLPVFGLMFVGVTLVVLLACANTHSLSTRSLVAQLRAGLVGAGVEGARQGPVEHEPTIDFPVASGEEPYLKICRVKLP